MQKLQKSPGVKRRESLIYSMELVRYQSPVIREGRLEIRLKATHAPTKMEAQSHAEEIGSLNFQIYTVIWYDSLHQINQLASFCSFLSCRLMWVDLLDLKMAKLQSYRNTDFTSTQAEVNDTCKGLIVEKVFSQKCPQADLLFMKFLVRL